MNKYHWRDQYKTIEGQSKFHEEVQQIFCTSIPFKNFKCYQEVAVCDLVESYSARNEHFDWYIEELNIIIELHGRQHYEVVNWGNMSGDEAVQKFIDGQTRDSSKQTAVEQAGYNYLAIPYTERKKLTASRLWNLIEKAL